MKLLTRIVQTAFALAALNAAYGLALLLGFSASYGNGQRLTWNMLGSIVSIAVYVIIILLLQRYYEHSTRIAGISSRKYLGMSIAAIGIAAITGLAIVASIVILAFAHLGG